MWTIWLLTFRRRSTSRKDEQIVPFVRQLCWIHVSTHSRIRTETRHELARGGPTPPPSGVALAGLPVLANHGRDQLLLFGIGCVRLGRRPGFVRCRGRRARYLVRHLEEKSLSAGLSPSWIVSFVQRARRKAKAPASTRMRG